MTTCRIEDVKLLVDTLLSWISTKLCSIDIPREPKHLSWLPSVLIIEVRAREHRVTLQETGAVYNTIVS